MEGSLLHDKAWLGRRASSATLLIYRAPVMSSLWPSADIAIGGSFAHFYDACVRWPCADLAHLGAMSRRGFVAQ